MNDREDLRFVVWLIALLLVVAGLSIFYVSTKQTNEDFILKAEPITTEQPTEQAEIIEELSGGHSEVEFQQVSEVSELPTERPSKIIYSDDELIAMVVHAEAGNQSMLGKTAVAAVVLNRCDAWGMTVESVIYQKDQFAIADTYTEDDMRAVEIAHKVRDLFPADMLYFRNKHYHTFGKPYLQIGGHYFSLEVKDE